MVWTRNMIFEKKALSSGNLKILVRIHQFVRLYVHPKTNSRNRNIFRAMGTRDLKFSILFISWSVSEPHRLKSKLKFGWFWWMRHRYDARTNFPFNLIWIQIINSYIFVYIITWKISINVFSSPVLFSVSGELWCINCLHFLFVPIVWWHDIFFLVKPSIFHISAKQKHYILQIGFLNV